MTIILDTLKEPLDNIALLIKFGVKGVFLLEICFVRNADNAAAFFKMMTNRLARIILVGKDFFTRKVKAVKKSKSRFTVMNLSAGQNHVQKLHSFVEQNMDFGGLAAA